MITACDEGDETGFINQRVLSLYLVNKEGLTNKVDKLNSSPFSWLTTIISLKPVQGLVGQSNSPLSTYNMQPPWSSTLT